MNKIYLIVVLLSSMQLNVFATEKPNGKPSEDLYVKYFHYKSLSPHQRVLFDNVMEEEFPERSVISEILDDNASTRNKMRLAEALFYRNQGNDVQNAIHILNWIFSLQNLDESSKEYAIWFGSPKQMKEKSGYDQNMREFIGTDLIVIYHKYKELLPLAVRKELETCIIRAATGAFMRDVDPDYNNISIMSSFMLEYVGTEFNITELKAAGIKKAKEIYAKFKKFNTLCEYNSPTYYGVDFVGLALWRELSFSNELKEMGKVLESELWLDVAAFYNANLQNICGPYLRSYGIDMKKYTAIVGVWIAVAVDDPEVATVPCQAGPHNECNFIMPILDLGISMPNKALEQFKQFDSSRYISRITSNYYKGDRLKKVTANIQQNWMMGGLWGNRKVSNILRTGTMHWKGTDGDVGWLYIPGEGKTNVQVDTTHMRIYLSDLDATEFTILAYSKNISLECFNDELWKFPLMQLGIKTTLNRKSTIVMDSDMLRQNIESSIYYPYAIKVVYEIPENWNVLNPLVIITPNYKLEKN